MRTFAIGDIHGEAAPLARLLDRIRPRAESGDTLLFLGDYINRGPNTRQVVELILAERQLWPGRVVTLMGNHEQMLRENLRSRTPSRWDNFVNLMGAAATVRSYGAEDLSQVRFEARLPLPHRQFFQAELERWYEDEHALYVHAGFPPDRHPRHCRAEELLWRSYERYGLEKPVVYGHMAQRSGRPLNEPDRICVDTGCGFGGFLTAVRLPEREFFSEPAPLATGGGEWVM